MKQQRICARLRLAARTLAGVALAVCIAFVGAVSANGAPPSNDNWASAISLLPAASGSTTGTNIEATTEVGEPLAVGSPTVTTSQTVWWTWVAPSSDEFTFDTTGSDEFTTLAVYTGASLATLAPVTTDADASTGLETRVFFDAVADTTYYIQVGTDPLAAAGPITLNWAANVVANNDFLDAIPLIGNEDSITGWNVGADLERPDEPGSGSCCLDHSVWYKWTPTATGVADFTLERDFSGSLSVWTGAALASLEFVANDSGGSPTHVHFVVQGGTTYYTQIGTQDSSPGTFALSWLYTPPPENDNLADALDVAGGQISQDGTTIAATLEDLEPTAVDFVGSFSHGGAQSVWYRWTPQASGPVVVSVEAVQDVAHAPLVQLYQGPATAPTFAALEVVGTHELPVNDPTDTLHAVVDGHDTYYIQVMGDFTSEQNTEFDFTLTAGFDDDFFADATVLEGNDGSIDGSTEGATTEEGEPDPSGEASNTVWYEWTPTVSGPATFFVDGEFDAAAAVYRGDALDTLRRVADDSGSGSLTLDFDAVAGTTYYIQVGAYLDRPGMFSLSWQIVLGREISGSVLDANGETVPDVLVRACLGDACTDTTSNSDGFYAFSQLAPGAYVVRALPSDPALLAAQADADVTLASAQGVDLRLATSGASSSDSGPSSFRVNGCRAGSLHYVVTGDGAALGPAGDVTDGADGTVDGVYTINVTSLNVGHVAMLRLDITIACGTATETQTAVLFTDPSGTVVNDAAGGAALAGATVTLLDANGVAIPAGDSRLSPATSANPETSDARGAWGWDVAPGTYLVRAQKTGCGTTTSDPLTVTASNPVVNVVLHLSCATAPAPGPAPLGTPVPTPPGFPPPSPPPATLPDPVAGVNFNVVPISGTVLVNGVVLPAGRQIPFGAIIDATNGIVSITTIGPTGAVQTAFFFGGVFQLLLAPDGVTNLVLYGGDFTVCPTAKVTKKATVKTTISRQVQGIQALHAKAKATSTTVVRALWGTGKGSFRTTGRFSSATVRGTLWYHADRCDGTYTQVTEGSVTVLDLPRKKVLIVKTGHSVLVRPK